MDGFNMKRSSGQNQIVAISFVSGKKHISHHISPHTSPESHPAAIAPSSVKTTSNTKGVQFSCVCVFSLNTCPVFCKQKKYGSKISHFAGNCHIPTNGNWIFISPSFFRWDMLVSRRVLVSSFIKYTMWVDKSKAKSHLMNEKSVLGFPGKTYIYPLIGITTNRAGFHEMKTSFCGSSG